MFDHGVSGEGVFLREVMSFRRKKKGKCKGFCFRDSEADQRGLQFWHIDCSSVNSCSSAPESNKQNPPDRAIDSPFFLKTSLRPQPSESLPYWFQSNCVPMFV